MGASLKSEIILSLCSNKVDAHARKLQFEGQCVNYFMDRSRRCGSDFCSIIRVFLLNMQLRSPKYPTEGKPTLRFQMFSMFFTIKCVIIDINTINVSFSQKQI